MYERKSAPAPPSSSGTQVPMRPSSSEPGEDLGRKTVLPIPRRGVWRDLGFRELARERLDPSLLVGEGEVHAVEYSSYDA